MIVGGNSINPAQLSLQQPNGSFKQKDVYPSEYGSNCKDEGILLFDANGDGKPDLYIARGGFQNIHGSNQYQDRLYINDGSGNFNLDTNALPKNYTSKLCVRAMDFNKD